MAAILACPASRVCPQPRAPVRPGGKPFRLFANSCRTWCARAPIGMADLRFGRSACVEHISRARDSPQAWKDQRTPGPEQSRRQSTKPRSTDGWFLVSGSRRENALRAGELDLSRVQFAPTRRASRRCNRATLPGRVRQCSMIRISCRWLGLSRSSEWLPRPGSPSSRKSI